MTLDRSCPVCSAEERFLLRSLDYALFDDLPFSGTTALVSCKKCGMVFSQLEGGSDALNTYYKSNNHYFFSQTPGSGGITEIDQRRYFRLFELLRLEQEKTKTILDFGCGKGGWLAWLNQIGFSSLIGIEASVACRQIIGNYDSVKIYSNTGALPEDEAPEIITFSHVLEHLHDPLLELKTLIFKSPKNAIFFIEVPNAPAMLKKANPWPDLFFEHINHFDEFSLKNLVWRAGLEIIQSGSWAFDPLNDKGDECLYLICRQGSYNQEKRLFSRLSSWPLQLAAALEHRPLSESFILSLDLRRPLALWGCSQYSMLVLGMHPEVRMRIHQLFDTSPAKIGRDIDGVKIQHSSQLRYLNKDYALLLPRSDYLDSMLKEISNTDIQLDTFIF
ncbi:class I SAM-dependent methyltransferase [Allochromatium vinosum]|uniref:Methyltransferase type 12 n=1 Tax=Allochromatium vinosum (strain ATCC 17899 / DSM 180 / NBRC 103801 / NCIMB 10441 / D) TaxID=572477 RepID=D3RUL0_ALLVD|nr:class I SAM-dependent methyltransferase [Allochromatium vinosum]ADC62869.1 hypothetical protein Alvin_1945 [Allochromatium vinosum DSM 180]